MSERIVDIPLSTHNLRDIQPYIKTKMLQVDITEDVGISARRIEIDTLEGTTGNESIWLMLFTLLWSMTDSKAEFISVGILYLCQAVIILFIPGTYDIGVVGSQFIILNDTNYLPDIIEEEIFLSKQWSILNLLMILAAVLLIDCL